MAGPKDIVESALEKGLDAICITEHESLRASAPFDTIPNHGSDLRGVETSTDMGLCWSTVLAMKTGALGQEPYEQRQRTHFQSPEARRHCCPCSPIYDRHQMCL